MFGKPYAGMVIYDWGGGFPPTAILTNQDGFALFLLSGAGRVGEPERNQLWPYQSCPHFWSLTKSGGKAKCAY